MTFSKYTAIKRTSYVSICIKISFGILVISSSVVTWLTVTVLLSSSHSRLQTQSFVRFRELVWGKISFQLVVYQILFSFNNVSLNCESISSFTDFLISCQFPTKYIKKLPVVQSLITQGLMSLRKKIIISFVNSICLKRPQCSYQFSFWVIPWLK